MVRQRILTKDFILVTLISMFGSLNYFALMVNIAGYATVTFSATLAEAGVAAGLYVIGGLLSRLTLGKYVELVGRKRMLISALIAAVLMSAAYFIVTSLVMLYCVRFLHGMAYGISSTCTSDIVSKLIPKERRGEGLGYFFLSSTISTALGPLIGLALSSGGDYSMVFWIGVLMYSLSLVAAVFLRVSEETLTEEEMIEARSFSPRNMIQFSAVPLAAVCMVFYFAYSGIHTFIAGYSEEIGLVEASSYFYLAVSAGTLISRFTTGRIFDRSGPNGIITVGFLSFIASMFVFSQSDTMVVFLGSGFFIGYGMSIVYSVGQAIVISKSTPKRYGVTTSTFAAMVDLGNGVGPMVLGLILPVIGYRDMYVTCAAIGAASLLLYWYVHGYGVAVHKG